MSKLIVDGKEIEFDMSRMKGLSDEYLQNISGGLQPINNVLFYSWFCKTCQAEGANFLSKDSASEDMKAHKAAKGHRDFVGICASYVDGIGYMGKGTWTETV
jgi:hypothetical protein